MRELGYALSEEYDCVNLVFFEYPEFDTNGFSDYIPEKIINDFFLFDFIELLLIFSKKHKRAQFSDLLNKVFREENTLFVVHNYTIVPKNST